MVWNLYSNQADDILYLYTVYRYAVIYSCVYVFIYFENGANVKVEAPLIVLVEEM